MIKTIYYEIKNNESIFFFWGWIFIALFSVLGNTSLALIFFITHFFYTFSKKKGIYLSRLKDIYKQKKISIIVLIFIIWGFISSFFAYDKKLAYLSIIGYTLILLIGFFISNDVIQYKKFILKILLPLSILGILISSIYTIYSYYILNLKRGETLFVGTNGAGTLLAFAVLFIIGYLEFSRTKRRYFLLIPVIIASFALLITFSRGALVGTIFAFSIYNLKSKKNILILIISIIILSSIIYINPQLRDRTISIISLERNQSRINLWQSTINIIKDHPITGIGPGNFSVVFPNYRLSGHTGANHPFSHNIFSNMAAELGILGLILFSLIIIQILKMGYYLAKINTLFRGLITGFIAMLVHQQFDGTILGLDIGGLFWIIAGLITNLYYKIEKKQYS